MTDTENSCRFKLTPKILKELRKLSFITRNAIFQDRARKIELCRINKRKKL